MQELTVIAPQHAKLVAAEFSSRLHDFIENGLHIATGFADHFENGRGRLEAGTFFSQLVFQRPKLPA